MKQAQLTRIAAAGVVELLIGCRGTAIDFKPTYESIHGGATRSEVLQIAGEPMTAEKWEFASISLDRMMSADASASYAVMVASIVFTEPRGVGKLQVAHLPRRRHAR